jgi:hypothetical protein
MDVVAWLLDSDPAMRWQVMRDLTDSREEDVAAERARVATEGWGARLLALQRQDGQWDGGTPTFTSTAAANWWQSLPPERQGTLFPQWTPQPRPQSLRPLTTSSGLRPHGDPRVRADSGRSDVSESRQVLRLGHGHRVFSSSFVTTQGEIPRGGLD